MHYFKLKQREFIWLKRIIFWEGEGECGAEAAYGNTEYCEEEKEIKWCPKCRVSHCFGENFLCLYVFSQPALFVSRALVYNFIYVVVGRCILYHIRVYKYARTVVYLVPVCQADIDASCNMCENYNTAF